MKYDKKKYRDFNDKIDSFIWNACLGGGFAFGFGASYLTYDRNKSYIRCVGETTIVSFYGFILGFTFILVSPIILPFATVIGVIRYLDSPKETKKN
jgi:hypothetical protein|uniref:Uncharacterized protein n=1 Tax=viral metagenome TaxID=1070528 RepID=A0A6C0HUG0_9ZZZZ